MPPIPESFLFELSNVSLIRGDEKTEYPVKAGAPPAWRMNRISFNAAKRSWTLIDRQVGVPKSTARDPANRVILSGDLTTDAFPGERRDSVERQANIIARILTFALGKDVKVATSHRIREGKSVSSSSASIHIQAFGTGSSSIIGNEETGDLRNLIENSYPIFEQDHNWWHRTIDFLLQAKSSPYIDIQAALLNILVDRLAAATPENRLGSEISKELSPFLKKNSPLHDSVTVAIQQLWAGWNGEHTLRYVIGHLSACNERPSFVVGIKRVCEKYSIEPPPAALLTKRHKLLHEGEARRRW